MAEILGFDAYSPKEIAEKVEAVGVVKAQRDRQGAGDHISDFGVCRGGL